MPKKAKKKYDEALSLLSFKKKNELLSKHCYAVTPKEFYDDIFPDVDIEREGHEDDAKPNMIIAYRIKNQKTGKSGMRNEIVFAGKAGLQYADKNDFALCSLCTYSGRRRTAKNAYRLYGFVFDLDGVGEEELKWVLGGIKQKDYMPCPQYIVNSGHGLHLYYIFEQPIPLFPKLVPFLQRLKHALTQVIWTNETSYIKNQPDRDNRDYLGIYQSYRMPGSCSKLGKGKDKEKYLVQAYRYNSFVARCSISELNKFVGDPWKFPVSAENPDYSSWDFPRMSLDECKKEWPEWYQRRIVEKKPPKQWVASPKLYDWWLRRIQNYQGGWGEEGARDGNRYYCIAFLFVMAIKCNISKEKAMADALTLIEAFDALTVKPDNKFTRSDVEAASEYYDRKYARLSIKFIEVKTHFHIARQLRKHKPQADHLDDARHTRDRNCKKRGCTWGNKDGAPKKQKIVQDWKAAHPDCKKVDCERETGLSRHTVLRWWDKPIEKQERPDAAEPRRLRLEDGRMHLTQEQLNHLYEQMFGDPPAETPAVVDASELEHESLRHRLIEPEYEIHSGSTGAMRK